MHLIHLKEKKIVLEWIIKDEIAINLLSSRYVIAKARNEGIRAIISLSEKQLPEEWIPKDMEYRCLSIKSYSVPDLFKLKEFFLYAGFLKRVKFPFVIYYANNLSQAALLSALYLVYNGETVEDAIETVSGKVEPHWTDEQMGFIHDVANHIKLFYLSKRIAKFYETDMLIHLLRKQCPWDREQTHKSLIPELIEEPLELVQAIKKESIPEVVEELGDVLLQILLHSAIGEENGKFSIDKVLDKLFVKMHRRHPHVFGKSNVKGSKEVLRQWETIKKIEKKDRPIDIAKVLAGLITSSDIQNEARKKGLDFSNINQIEQKIEEELGEVKREIKRGKDPSYEIGDLIFSVVNLSRFLDIDPAHALFISMEKFRKRFEKVKEKTNNNIESFSEKQLDRIWAQIKNEERREKN